MLVVEPGHTQRTGHEQQAGEPYAELLQRRAARDGLGHSLRQFVEFIRHTFPFVLVLLSFFVCSLQDAMERVRALSARYGAKFMEQLRGKTVAASPPPNSR